MTQLHTYYNGVKQREKQDREWSKTQKQRPSSDCRLQLACTKSELLVIVDQHATVNTFGRRSTPPVTP